MRGPFENTDLNLNDIYRSSPLSLPENLPETKRIPRKHKC